MVDIAHVTSRGKDSFVNMESSLSTEPITYKGTKYTLAELLNKVNNYIKTAVTRLLHKRHFPLLFHVVGLHRGAQSLGSRLLREPSCCMVQWPQPQPLGTIPKLHLHQIRDRTGGSGHVGRDKRFSEAAAGLALSKPP